MISIASPTNVCFLSFALLVSVSLWLFIAWKVWRRWMASVRLTASDAAPIYPDTLIQHVESQMPRLYEELRKHNGSSINQDDIEHAHASSSRKHRTHSSRSPHNTSQERETDGLLSPRALSQRSYSGVSSNHRPSQRQHHSRSQTRDINPSRVLTDHTNAKNFESPQHNRSGRHKTKKDIDGNPKQSLPATKTLVIVSTEEFDDLLQKGIQQILQQTFVVESSRWAPRPTDTPGKRYRELAREEANLRKFAFEAAKQAKKAGKWGDVKKYTDEGKRHDENVKHYNRLASEEIFRTWNPKRTLTKCDLHGLHVEESLEYARQHLIACRSAGVDKTMLIVGKGSHSQPGGPRIGPAISDMLRGIADVVADAHENNSGAIVVEFTRC